MGYLHLRISQFSHRKSSIMLLLVIEREHKSPIGPKRRSQVPSVRGMRQGRSPQILRVISTLSK